MHPRNGSAKASDFPIMRRVIMGLSLLAGLAAIWAGWVRLGWQWPVLQPGLPLSHGPLMVSGFLGTLIGLERAVALRNRWSFSGPLLTGLGGLLLLIGWPAARLVAAFLMTLGSLVLLVVFAVIVKRHPARFTTVMALGVLCWLTGNLLWMLGWPIYHIVLWWAGFLVLTIAGERLELGQLARLSAGAENLFLGAVGLFMAGLIFTIPAPGIMAGTRLAGIGMLALAAWLLKFDIARRTIRKPGLPRYAAICLLSGYIWLAAAGLLGIVYGGVIAGPHYDALLHAIFLGFVFAMIFAHAPIILPAILQIPLAFSPFFYLPLGLLHLSLLLRVSGDLLFFSPLRLWGGLLNGFAILLFFATAAATILGERQKSKHENPVRLNKTGAKKGV